MPWLFMRHAPPRSSLLEPQVCGTVGGGAHPAHGSLSLTARTTEAFVGGTCGVGVGSPPAQGRYTKTGQLHFPEG